MKREYYAASSKLQVLEVTKFSTVGKLLQNVVDSIMLQHKMFPKTLPCVLAEQWLYSTQLHMDFVPHALVHCEKPVKQQKNTGTWLKPLEMWPESHFLKHAVDG